MRIIFILWCVLITGCSHSITLPAFTDGYPGTPLAIEQSVIVEIPSNWHKWNFKKWGSLKRTGQLNLVPGPIEDGVEGPIIRVIFGRLDPTSSPTPEGQVSGYIDTMRIKEDSTVVLVKYESLYHPVYGNIPVWYMHSSYSGHRLRTEYINRDAGLSIELTCDSREELKKYEVAFSSMAKSFRIKY